MEEINVPRIERQHDDGENSWIPIDPPSWIFQPRRRHEALNDWHLGKLSQYVTKDTSEADRGRFSICALEIPWSDDEEDVMRAFRLWFRRFMGARHRRNKAGRKHEWRNWFRDLAIFRLSGGGYARRDTLQLLGIKPINKKGDGLSPQNWARAKRNTKTALSRRYAELLTKAKRHGQDWKRCFIQQPIVNNAGPIPDK
jgi:hypothetical protein